MPTDEEYQQAMMDLSDLSIWILESYATERDMKKSQLCQVLILTCKVPKIRRGLSTMEETFRSMGC